MVAVAGQHEILVMDKGLQDGFQLAVGNVLLLVDHHVIVALFDERQVINDRILVSK